MIERSKIRKTEIHAMSFVMLTLRQRKQYEGTTAYCFYNVCDGRNNLV